MPTAARGLRAAAVAALAALLSGCVAALAPVAAAGAVGAQTFAKKPQRAAVVTLLPAVVEDAGPIEPPAPAGAGGADDFSGRGLVRRAGAQGTSPAARLVGYVAAGLAPLPGTANRRSALLANPEALDPTRTPCGEEPPAVLVDLDPGRDTFDPIAPGLPAAGFAAALAQLRAQGVAIAWSTRLGSNFRDPVRAALSATGLDPEGRDAVLTMQTLDERKQSHRRTIGMGYCLLAIVGDDKADFDELYDYLRDTGRPLPIDSLIGDGWFLIPPFPPQS